jgi:hypothetical protein
LVDIPGDLSPRKNKRFMAPEKIGKLLSSTPLRGQRAVKIQVLMKIDPSIADKEEASPERKWLPALG